MISDGSSTETAVVNPVPSTRAVLDHIQRHPTETAGQRLLHTSEQWEQSSSWVAQCSWSHWSCGQRTWVGNCFSD